MNSKIYWAVILFLLVCNIYLFFSLQKSREQLQQINGLETSVIESKLRSYLLYRSADETIPDTFAYWGRAQKDSFRISTLCTSPKLVFRYSMAMCQPCINEVVSAISELFPDYEKNEYIIFSCKDLEERLKDNFFKKKHLTSALFTSLPIEEEEVPYLFILDKDMRAKKLYPVFKGSKQELREYLKMIKEKFPQ